MNAWSPATASRLRVNPIATMRAPMATRPTRKTRLLPRVSQNAPMGTAETDSSTGYRASAMAREMLEYPAR